MKKQILIPFLMLLAISGMAQKLPDWIINKPTPTNSTYLYVVESATGQTEMQARNRAIAEVFRSTAMRIGQPFDSEEINRALQRGTEYYVISSQYNIPINKVCEYTDNKTSPCRVYVLCQVAKAGNIHVEFDDFKDCYEGANKMYADEALYADGFTISQNGRKLSDHEIRTMFANSKSYALYDAGMRKNDFVNHEWEETIGVFYGGLGVLSIITGSGISLMGYVSAAEHQSDADEAKDDMDYWLSEYGEYYCEHYCEGYIKSKKEYEDELNTVEKKKQLGKTGLWVIGGGTLLVVSKFLLEKTILASGKAKIRRAVNLYNNGKMYSQSELEMEYGLTGNGVYLTFNF